MRRERRGKTGEGEEDKEVGERGTDWNGTEILLLRGWAQKMMMWTPSPSVKIFRVSSVAARPYLVFGRDNIFAFEFTNLSLLSCFIFF